MKHQHVVCFCHRAGETPDVIWLLEKKILILLSSHSSFAGPPSGAPGQTLVAQPADWLGVSDQC